MVQENEKSITPAAQSSGERVFHMLFNPNIGPLQRVDNFMRMTANYMTFGFADIIAGTLDAKLKRSTSCSTAALCIEDELKKSVKAQRDTPLESAAGMFIGIYDADAEQVCNQYYSRYAGAWVECKRTKFLPKSIHQARFGR